MQNAHAGKTKVIPQFLNVGRNHAQVFGDDRQFAELAANRGEQFSTGSFDPAATLRSRVASRNFPTRSKSAKMVDPRNVNHLKSGPHAFNPPFETIRQHPLPIEDRISPVLSGLAEIIRRHAGDNDRSAIGIELELIWIGPDIRRIVRHKDRNVADHFDAAPVAVGLQIEPLFEEEKLIELLRFDLVMKFLTSAPQGRGCTPSQRLFPLVPCGATVNGFQRAEQCIVIKPRSVLFSEDFERTAEFGVCGLLICGECFSENGILNFMRARKIDAVGWPRRHLGQLIFSQQPCF